MTPIDLFDYTNSGEKLPTELLEHSVRAHKKVELYEIATAYIVDFTFVVTVSSVMTNFLELSMSHFITQNLASAYRDIPFASFHLSLLPVIFVTYFFACCFFNDGQSLGMKCLSTRISLPAMDFRTSLVWAIFSGSAMMTGGLTILCYRWLQESQVGEFKDHDHLYIDLVQERNLSPVNLVEIAYYNSQQPAFEEDQFQRAA